MVLKHLIAGRDGTEPIPIPDGTEPIPIPNGTECWIGYFRAGELETDPIFHQEGPAREMQKTRVALA